MKKDFLDNKAYLDQFECCDPEECGKLVGEYQNLLHKCHDTYGKTGAFPLTEKGAIIGDSFCDSVKNKIDLINMKSGGRKCKSKKTKKHKPKQTKKNKKTKKTNKK